jgi:DNA-binding MarR family transcriptional regulator
VAVHGSESDRRAKLVGLSRAGRALVERVLAVHVGKVRSVMSTLEAREQRELHTLMVRLNGGIRAMIEAEERGADGGTPAKSRPAARRAV